jgi:excisionase family DNA binding protein
MPLVIGYGTKGAAWMLGVSVSTIKRMVYRGELKPINLEGTPYLFKCSDVEALRRSRG